ncbi:response regulator transcription factor [Pelagerythrobacter rhizovicinus]|uniref:Response regulator n=1 Tax=Pelagerythrobacter rhizovicinus TaxID=2268576 RepID=A0A4Q2KNZ0_9SPHN|nr:response regulator [Pelagerythrobacter rhizovicinus]RXZ66197.1 response regulator [Pelagerythrobacter rhizovicinus]
MASAMRRAYIIDDDSGIRRSMQFALSAAGYQSRPFLSGQDFLEELPHLDPGCIFLDVRMPDMNGLQVLTALRKINSRFPVVMMTGHGDVPTAVEAMKLGAADFLEKPFEENEVLKLLEALCTRLEARLEDDRVLEEGRQKIALLNERELSVLRGLIAGYSNRQVAERLDLSVRTVEAYRANLMAKLGISSLADLVRLGLVVNLSPLD